MARPKRPGMYDQMLFHLSRDADCVISEIIGNVHKIGYDPVSSRSEAVEIALKHFGGHMTTQLNKPILGDFMGVPH